MKIGIVDYNPDKNPDRRNYVERIGSLLPEGVDHSGIPFRDTDAFDDLDQMDALILSGSKLSATLYHRAVNSGEELEGDYISVDESILPIAEFSGPIFGICFGAQILAHVKGGTLGRLDMSEAGYLTHELTEAGSQDPIFGQVDQTFWGAHMHTDYVDSLPDNSEMTGDAMATRGGYIHAFRIVEAGETVHYGTQPHPEMSNPNNATFLVDVNRSWLEEEIGAQPYQQALIVPGNATFQLGSTVTQFVNHLHRS